MKLPNRKLMGCILLAAPALAIGIDAVSDYLARRTNSTAAFAFIPGVRDPVLHSAREVVVDHGDEVIGVSFGGEHRAYAVHAMNVAPHRRVVNDLIAGVPITVTYCERTKRARVFTTSERAGEALAVGVCGFQSGRLALHIDGREYAHDSDAIPLTGLPFEKMSWGEWKAAHPDARIYLGRATSQPAAWAMIDLPMGAMDVRLTAPGIRDPIVQTASEPVPSDDMPVLGVSVAGHARAYSVSALSAGPSSHVINDLIEGVPVTVTFCDLTRCARVFTKAGSSAVLDLAVGGLRRGKMMLVVNGREFAQDDARIPLDDLPHEATTWREWKAAHPDTDVYVGRLRQTVPDGAAAD